MEVISLKDAGVPVTLKREEGQIHGFLNFFSLMDSREDIKETYEDIAAFLLNDTNVLA